ncbi:MAG: right-handed parallel beta-helix repeat-containing protein [Promethearchaeota archaeon]
MNKESPSIRESVLDNFNSPLKATNHDPIYIDGNVNLTTFITNEGLSGDGTFASPYVIENFVIDASNQDGISISNTDAYLTIQNCTVSMGADIGYVGIHLYYAGNVTINNNNLTSNYDGIYLHYSNNNSLSGNTIDYNADNGIRIYNSNNNTLSENTIDYNADRGIEFVNSNNNTFFGNTINHNVNTGIHLQSSHNNTISENFLSYNGIDISFSFSSTSNILSGNMMYGSGISLSERGNFIDTSNKLNDKSVRIYENTTGVILSWEIDVGQVILLYCNDSIIEGLNISNSYRGIVLEHSFNCSISDNTLSTENAAISLYYSSNNTLSGNMMYGTGIGMFGSKDNLMDTTNKINNKSLRYYENTPGVHLSGDFDVGQVILMNCNNSIIEGLSIADTIGGIIVRESSYCLISENTIVDCYNGIILDESVDSSILQNTVIGGGLGIFLIDTFNPIVSGNYVSSCTFAGIVLSKADNATVVWNIATNSEHGFFLILMTYSTVFGNILFNNSIYGINLLMGCSQNTIYFNDIYQNQKCQAYDSSGSTDNEWDNGTTGNYWGDDYTNRYPSATNDGYVWNTPYEINGTDYGVDNFPLVNLAQPDVEAPIFSNLPEDFTANEGYSGLNISWNVTDLNPGNYMIEQNGTELVSATAWSNGIAILFNIPNGLSEGFYNYSIFVSDENGNTARDTIILTILSNDPSDVSDDSNFFDDPLFLGLTVGGLIVLIVVATSAYRIMSDRTKKSELEDFRFNED